MTRREFHLALMTSAAALAARSGAQEPFTQPTDAPSVAAIHAWLPASLPPEQMQKVAETVRAMRKTLQDLRAYPLPEGSEPAFVFQPCSPRKEKR